MGYRTDFELDTVEALDEDTRLMIDGYLNQRNIPVILYGQWYGKWYQWEQDISVLAQQFPEATFVLYGNGEEDGDIWRAFFKGDQVEVQDGEITYPEAPDFVEADPDGN